MGRSERLIWLSWRVTAERGVEAHATLERDGELMRERWSFDTLEEAADALGESFREVVERVLETGRSSGRWRP